MYNALIVIFLLIVIALFGYGIQHRRISFTIGGIAAGAMTLGFFWFMDFWGELLWFAALGYDQRFWTEILAKTGSP